MSPTGSSAEAQSAAADDSEFDDVQEAEPQPPQPPSFELHGYQKDYLATLAKANAKDEAGVLRALVEKAAGSEAVREAIFGTFHCVHCNSVSPAEWINARKGKKEPYELDIGEGAVGFLSQELLLKVGPPGPKKAVQPGPKRADRDKAARCVIDWAVKHYGAQPERDCLRELANKPSETSGSDEGARAKLGATVALGAAGVALALAALGQTIDEEGRWQTQVAEAIAILGGCYALVSTGTTPVEAGKDALQTLLQRQHGSPWARPIYQGQ